MDVMKNIFNNAPYLDLLDLNTQLPENYAFPTENAKKVVQEYRNRKSLIISAATAVNEDIDQEEFHNFAGRKKLQHHYFTFLSSKEIKDYEAHIIQSGFPHDRARSLSTDGSFAGAWLHSIPKKNERQLSNDEFRKALWLRLGIPFSARPYHCSCMSKSTCY